MKPLFHLERPVQGIATPEFFGTSSFMPLSKPTGNPPYHLDLQRVIAKADYNHLVQSNKMVFHTVGDTGGVKTPANQTIVADHMEMQFNEHDTTNNPSFFYHLGDLVYYYGELKEYNSQFYEPYKFYPAPIFAIPGNHDGDIDPTAVVKPTSLEAFTELFCAKTNSLAAVAGDAPRTTIMQPNVYWTLVTPVANIIGLYTNVPSGGVVKQDQQNWFINELMTAQKERNSKALIVALHHPPYSMDAHHGSSIAMQAMLEKCFAAANVQPDIVLSGHVHNYQRFTKKEGKIDIPYIVAGAGGYWHLHNVNTKDVVITTPCASTFPNVRFDKFSDDRHGFLRMTIDMNAKKMMGEYFTVPRSQESWKADPVLFDRFIVDLAKHKVRK